MSLKDDYDEAIEITAKHLKRTILVLMGVAIAGFFTGSLVQSTFAIAILLIGFFGAHRRHTCLLMTVCLALPPLGGRALRVAEPFSPFIPSFSG